jgi:phage gpG-like protein
MTPEQFTKGLAQMTVDVRKFVHAAAPKIAGKTAADFFTENFTQRQGSLNGGVTPWQEVQRRLPKANGRPRTKRETAAAGRRILFGETRNLSRSIDYETREDGVTVFSDVAYDPYHNDGTDKIPQRQLMGDSAELDALVMSEIERKLKNIINRA